MGLDRSGTIALLLVCLAGCSGVVSQADPGPISVTPAAVPTDRPTASETGDTIDGPIHPRQARGYELAAAHRSFLANRSFTVTTTQTITFPEENRTSWWRMTGAFEPSGEFLIQTERAGSVFAVPESIRIQHWSDGEQVLERVVRNQSTAATVVRDDRGVVQPPREVLWFDPEYESELGTLFTTTRLSDITYLESENTSYQRLRTHSWGENLSRGPGLLGYAVTVEFLRVTMVMDTRGLVHRFHLRYTGRLLDRPIVVSRAVSFSKVGETVVERPDWAVNVTTGDGGSATETGGQATEADG